MPRVRARSHCRCALLHRRRSHRRRGCPRHARAGERVRASAPRRAACGAPRPRVRLRARACARRADAHAPAPQSRAPLRLPGRVAAFDTRTHGHVRCEKQLRYAPTGSSAPSLSLSLSCARAAFPLAPRSRPLGSGWLGGLRKLEDFRNVTQTICAGRCAPARARRGAPSGAREPERAHGGALAGARGGGGEGREDRGGAR